MMYYDLKALFPPMKKRAPASNEPYSIKDNQHVPCGWNVRSKFAYGDVVDPEKSYRGENCIKTLCEHLIEEACCLYKMFPEKPMDPLTEKEWRRYRHSTKCHICYKSFTPKNPKIRDHCNYTGHYRGLAHRNCNLRYRIPSYITVIAHNSARYDTHLFIKELGEHFENIGVIDKNKEEYVTFSVEVVVDKYINRQGLEKEKFMGLRFINSFKFMAMSFDLLVKNLVNGGQRLAGFEEYLESQNKLLTRKGIYLYEYMTSWDRFEETQLRPIEAFYSELNMFEVSEDDYQHAQQVWKEFGIRNLGEYHDLYLRTDVVLLENVFEKFRETPLKHYGIDPVHFYTLPGFAWKACLKKLGLGWNS